MSHSLEYAYDSEVARFFSSSDHVGRIEKEMLTS